MTGDLRVIGIGASAGGIEALRAFFQHVPPHSSMAFVIVLHLSPDRTSMLAEVLGRWTDMSVTQAVDGEAVQADHVHVIPPNTLMTIEVGHLRLRTPSTPMRENNAIDIFFSALAADQGERAIGIVLSGTGSDGTLGLKAIRQAGGIALAQGGNGTGPQYPGMPSSAIAAGAVDLILSVEAMPERILQLNVPLEAPADDAPMPAAAEIAEVRPVICALLRNQVGHDFSGYKEATFMRRVHRRMQFLGLGMKDYVQRLRDDPHEVVLLFHDLLIGVTSFFRDADAFQALSQTVIPRLFEGRGADDTVRIWVPGCATGEETYTIAILMAEHMAGLQAPPKMQIFATDIDDAAINVARSGRYPATLLKELSPERLARFFIAADGTYLVRKEIRDLCTFSTHSLIRDPPFSRIDLISCRNLLIYLDADLQGRVIPAFHYSLVPHGYLLLGGSEMVTRHGELFTPIDKKHRIFERRDAPASPLHLAPLNTFATRSAPPVSRRRDPAAGWGNTAQLANDRVLERFGPPFVVVNEDGNVLHFSSRTGKYLEPPTGIPSSELVSLARQGLRLELRAAFRQALQTGRAVERERINVEMNGGSQPISLIIEPLTSRQSDRLFLVVFNDLGIPVAAGHAPAHSDQVLSHGTQGEEPGTAHLERELHDAHQQLQSTSEEYETALEELKSANEELQSVNEEMQSTNEELETSKEEIQSMNEELQTVNAQLSAKVDELDHANNDLRNLFDSTEVATIFLDCFMIVRGFTPAVADIYNLIPSDKGRPLNDIVGQIDYDELRSDVTRVLDTLEPFERRVARRDGNTHYLMRVLPYRAADNKVDGALVTFVDVTSIVQAEQHHRMMVDELNHRVRNMLTVVVSLATQTLRQSKTLEDFSDAFLGRVNALASAYTLLSRENWIDVPLQDVLQEELRAFMSDRRDNIVLKGPRIPLKPRAALAFGMIVHELVTNAVKYGALSAPAGRVIVNWEVQHQDDDGDQDNGGHLVLTWQEQDGPQIVPPEHHGFGLSMIERSLKHELKGEAKISFEPTGLHVELIMPMDPMLIGDRNNRETKT